MKVGIAPPTDAASAPRLASRSVHIVFAMITFLTATVAIHSTSGTATYTADSFIYARMMLDDRHLAAESAMFMNRQFFAKQFAGNSDLLSLVEPNPPQYFINQGPLFISRPLYPYLSSLLFDVLGYRAMPFISSVAYVLVACTLFWVLCSFGPPWVAAIVAMSAVLLPSISYPSILDLGTYALTDSLALFLGLLGLLAEIRYTITGRAQWLLTLFLSAIAFALTRPAIYLLDGGAIGVLIFGSLRHDQTVAKRGVVLSGICAFVSAAYMLYAFAAHGPGITQQITYLYDRHLAIGNHKELTFGAWYCLQILRTVIFEITDVMHRPLAAFTAVVGLFGLFVGKARAETASVVGMILSLTVAVVTNPVPGDSGRPVEVPMVPLLAVGIVLLIVKIVSMFGAADRANVRSARS